MGLYRYLFYRIYIWFKRRDELAPLGAAIFIVSNLMAINIEIIILVINILGVKFPRNILEWIPIFAISLFVMNYFLFIHKGKYKKMEIKYKNESKTRKLRNTLLLWIYIILSFYLVVKLAIYSGEIDRKKEESTLLINLNK